MNNYFNYFWDLLIIAPALVGIATSKATETNYNVIIGKISFLNIWTLFNLKFPKAQTFAKMTKKRES